MFVQKYRKPLIAVLSVICLILAGLCWYLFDTNVDRSGWVNKDGIYAYRDFHGRKVTGWQEIDGNRYYFQEDHTMATGWLMQEENTYYLGSDGTLDRGWISIEEDWYYSDESGVIQTGWQDIQFQRYYFRDDGIMYTGWMEQDGKQYHLAEDGAMSMGFVQLDNQTYYFSENGVMHTGALSLDEDMYLFLEDGTMHTGWLEHSSGISYYQPDSGTLVTDWQEIEGKRYFFDTDGIMQTGWMHQGEYRYYLHADGSAAVGPTDIDGTTYYFSPKGIHVVLVNTQHKVPDYYELNLATVQDWHRVSEVCLEPLKQMLADCKAAGIKYTFNSAYRSIGEQSDILQKRTQEYQERGLDPNAAYRKARETVALPGTSEHHLGLAVDLLGEDAIAWLNQHCWEYGFIRRYTAEKEHITGFVDEPWHFRYVGTEISLDMKDSGLCLEEYLGAYPTEE